MHAQVNSRVCSVDTLWSGVLLYQKKKRTACKCALLHEGDREHMRVCGRLQPRRGSPRPRPGPASSHPNLEWQQRADGPTQTPTGAQTRREQGGGAKVNR